MQERAFAMAAKQALTADQIRSITASIKEVMRERGIDPYSPAGKEAARRLIEEWALFAMPEASTTVAYTTH